MPRSSRTSASSDALLVLLAAVGDRFDHRPLALEQRGDRLVDRLGRQQVVGRDGVALADPVAAVLGLVVLGGGPVELEEGDVRGRASASGPGRRPPSSRRSAGSRGRPASWKARSAASRAPGRDPRRGCAARAGKRSTTARWTSRWRAKTTSRSPEEEKSWIQASAEASLPRAASSFRAFRRTSRSARSAAATFASSSRRSSGWVRSQASRSRSASRYSASLSSSTGTTARVLAGSWGSTSRLSRRTIAARPQVPVQPLVRVGPAEAGAELDARAEVLEPAEDAQLGDQLGRAVDDRRAAERQHEAVGGTAAASFWTARVRLAAGFLQ